VRQIRARGPSQTRMRAIVRALMQSSCAVRASADGDGWAGVVRGGTSVGGIVGVSVNSPRFHGAPMRSGTPVLSNAVALEVLRTCRCHRMCRCGRLEGRRSRTAWVLSGEGHGRCATCTRSAELVYVRCAALGNNRSRASGAHARALGGAARVLLPVSVVVSGVCGSRMSSMRAACAQAGMGMCD
jgi:hypothetical protein